MDINNTVKLEMMNEKCRTSTGSMCLPVEMCVVCGDRASGRHYGAISCEGCKGFFKRSIRKQLGYQCRGTKNCEVTKHHRNRCQYCRLQKCLSCGMRSDSVQHERKPIIDKRDYSNNTTATTLAFTPNPLSKIFIRKDLGLEQTASLASTFNLADLGASSHETNYNISPSHASFEDDASMDSDTQGDNNDAVSLARNRSIISKAWDTMARVQYLTNNNANDRDSTFELEGPVLLEQHIPFTLQTPGPVPPYLNAHYICESGSRLLFLTVHWVRNIPAFHMFGNDIQIAMLRGCWSELFILGLSQCAQILSLASILSSFINHLHSSIAQEKISTSKVKQVTDHICRIQDYVKAMEQLHLDEHEYAYLKAIVLFSTDLTDLLPRCQLERFQEKSFQGLRSYVHNSFPGDADRFPKLLLRLPPLRAFEAHIIEELFFSGLIGHVQINNVIPYILRMGNGGRAVKVEQNNTEDDYGFKKH